uniref:Uncharacterized protein n=1 Tax=Tetranychus urticae TaxID=32264 RepID=T1KEZ5_TETUR
MLAIFDCRYQQTPIKKKITQLTLFSFYLLHKQSIKTGQIQ